MVSRRVIHTMGVIRSWLADWLGSVPPAFEKVIDGPVQIVAASAARAMSHRPRARIVPVTAGVIDVGMDFSIRMNGANRRASERSRSDDATEGASMTIGSRIHPAAFGMARPRQFN
jgi:hypothetical protein